MARNTPLIEENKSHALKYASIGIAVHPLESYAKQIYKDGGWENGTCDTLEVEQLFSNNDNITGMCIIPEKSTINVVALDVDEHTGSGKAELDELEKRLGALPTEWMQKTTSGGERRLFITRTKISKTINLTENIELIAGKHCAAVAPTKAYKWQSPAEEKNKIPKEKGDYTIINEEGESPPMIPEAWEKKIIELIKKQKPTNETVAAGESIVREIKDLEGKIGNRHNTLKCSVRAFTR